MVERTVRGATSADVVEERSRWRALRCDTRCRFKAMLLGADKGILFSSLPGDLRKRLICSRLFQWFCLLFVTVIVSYNYQCSGVGLSADFVFSAYIMTTTVNGNRFVWHWLQALQSLSIVIQFSNHQRATVHVWKTLCSRSVSPVDRTTNCRPTYTYMGPVLSVKAFGVSALSEIYCLKI